MAAALMTWLVDPAAAPRKFRSVTFGPDIRLGGTASTGPGTGQSEPTIAVNPVNPANLVAGFIDYSLADHHSGHVNFLASFDGGVSWAADLRAPLIDSHDASGDPSFAGDLTGNLLYNYLEFKSSGGTLTGVDDVVSKSTDGGRSFGTPALAADGVSGTVYDKPYMTIDAQPKSRFRGTAYVAVPDFLNGMTVFTSRDGGTTWSAPILIAPLTNSFQNSPVPLVAPDGTVYVIYVEYRFSFLPPYTFSIRFSKSADGGRTWSAPATALANLPTPGEFSLKNADPSFGTSAGPGLEVTSFPSATITPTGDIYITWIDFPNGSCASINSSRTPCLNADVRLTVSRDKGRSWSAPVKVNDDATQSDQFFPWMAAHPDGLVSIVWLDRRLDPNNVNFDAFYTNTYDGVNFLPNVRINTVTSLLGDLGWIGDYQGIAASAGGVFPIWNDTRSGTPATFFARGTLGP